MTVPLHQPVGELKRAIAAEYKLPVGDFRLVLYCKDLCESQTLAQAGVLTLSTLEVVPRLRGGTKRGKAPKRSLLKLRRDRKRRRESSGHMTRVNRTQQRADCHRRKSDRRFSPEVRTNRSTGGQPGEDVSRQRSRSSSKTSAGWSLPPRHAPLSRPIAAAISLREVYEKQMFSSCLELS